MRPAVRLGRYWLADSYAARHAAGQEPQSIDKEFLRLWFRANCDPYADAVPPPQGSWPWAATMCLYQTVCRGPVAPPGSGPHLFQPSVPLKLTFPQARVVLLARLCCCPGRLLSGFTAAWRLAGPCRIRLLGAGALRHANVHRLVHIRMLSLRTVAYELTSRGRSCRRRQRHWWLSWRGATCCCMRPSRGSALSRRLAAWSGRSAWRPARAPP